MSVFNCNASIKYLLISFIHKCQSANLNPAQKFAHKLCLLEMLAKQQMCLFFQQFYAVETWVKQSVMSGQDKLIRTMQKAVFFLVLSHFKPVFVAQYQCLSCILGA